MQECFTTIMRKYKAEWGKEIQGTGLGGEEPTEGETLLENLVKKYQESDSKIEQKVTDKKQLKKTETALDKTNCNETI